MGGTKEWGGAKEWGGEGTGGKPHGSEVIPGTVRGRREVKGVKLVGNSQNVKKSDGSYLGFGYFSHKKTSPTSPGRGRQGQVLSDASSNFLAPLTLLLNWGGVRQTTVTPKKESRAPLGPGASPSEQGPGDSPLWALQVLHPQHAGPVILGAARVPRGIKWGSFFCQLY